MSESRYSRLVRAHWEQFRPRELARMQDPDAFFTRKGQELHEALIEAQEALETSLPAEPNYQARVGQLKQIRATAEQQVRAELLPPPEEDD
jgi:hypothetical protein